MIGPMALQILTSMSFMVYTSYTRQNVSPRTAAILYSASVGVSIVALAIVIRRGLALRKRLREHCDRLCLRCQYPLLEGVERGACPECGQVYTLSTTVAAWSHGRGRAFWRR